MIRHVVMWKMKDRAEGSTGKENARKLREMILALRKPISEIVDLEVGLPKAGSDTEWEVVLVSSFRSAKDLDAYQRHPEHQKVVKFVGSVTSARAAADYEI